MVVTRFPPQTRFLPPKTANVRADMSRPPPSFTRPRVAANFDVSMTATYGSTPTTPSTPSARSRASWSSLDVTQDNAQRQQSAVVQHMLAADSQHGLMQGDLHNQFDGLGQGNMQDYGNTGFQHQVAQQLEAIGAMQQLSRNGEERQQDMGQHDADHQDDWRLMDGSSKRHKAE